ncbi:uncharacterized protein LOC124912297 [Impatiens glandulifera]|uniref:uncharacterized protein LOC124912297 n=1 Tax=Impatiens glandulifera TaxID=253017 RepID=UPI001FB11E83|nr:uncharacterized protein LOC124912297 [Impatiens glandulifera]
MSKMRSITPQIQHFAPSSIMKSTSASSDEFKNGFPIDGLSVVSHRWWGTSNVTENENSGINETIDVGKESNELEGEKAHTVEVIDGNIDDPQGIALLLSIRRRAAENGRKAIKLGVYRGDGSHKLGMKERKLIHRIFKSSFCD